MRAERPAREAVTLAASERSPVQRVAVRVDRSARGDSLRVLAGWVRSAQPAQRYQFESADEPRIPSRHARGAVPGPVAQLVWSPGPYPQQWDGLIDGVQWYRLEDERIWYENVGQRPEFALFAGRKFARTFDAWDKVEARGMAAVISDRLATYQDDITRGMKKGELRKFEEEFKKTRGVSKIDREVTTPVIRSDAQRLPKEDSPEWAAYLGGWLVVEDSMGRLPPDAHAPKAAAVAPEAVPEAVAGAEGAAAPKLPSSVTPDEGRPQTKFQTMFHPRPDGAPGELDGVVMMEYYRESKRPYFASDAFFEQWRRVAGVKTIDELPSEFPQFVYRNNISNQMLQPLLKKIMGDLDHLDVFGNVHGEDLIAFKNAENVKATNQIIADFNAMNAFRREPQFKVVQIRIIKVSGGHGLRFTIGKM